MRTNSAMRTVKSCGPGIPVLMPIRRRCADDGGKNAGPRGEHEAAVKTIAQGVPAVPAALSLLACANVHFLCTQGSRVRPASGIPCALFVQRDDE